MQSRDQDTVEALADETIVLASSSPRRRELLTRAGVPHVVHPANIDESPLGAEPARKMTLRLARDKALAVAREVGDSPRRLVLGSDTVVVLDGAVLGKPDDADHAVRLLQMLCGRTHRVITGVAVVDSATLAVRACAVESRVTLRSATEAELREYVATGEPLDKAGAYAIQGIGRMFVASFEGSETNVIGLPVEETLALLRSAGARLEPDP